MNHQPLQLRTQYATEEFRHRRQLYGSNQVRPKRYVKCIIATLSATTQGPCTCNRNTRLCGRTLRNCCSCVSTCSTTGSRRSGLLAQISSSCSLIPPIRVVKVFDRPPSLILAVFAVSFQRRFTEFTQDAVEIVEAEEVLTLIFSGLSYISGCRQIHHQPLSKQRLQPKCVLPQQRWHTSIQRFVTPKRY